jgi:hypothetical protein
MWDFILEFSGIPYFNLALESVQCSLMIYSVVINRVILPLIAVFVVPLKTKAMSRGRLEWVVFGLTVGAI